MKFFYPIIFDNQFMTKTIYFRTFAKVAIVPYIGGTVAHTLRLIYKFPIVEAPFWIHWVIVLLGGYASLGFIFHVSKIKFHGIIDKILYGLVIFHLGGSVIMHAYSLVVQNNNWMDVFSLEYSYFAIVYFVGLGLYCKSLSKRIDAQ